MRIPILLSLAVALILAACGPGHETRGLKEGETLRVMASTPHLASIAMAIAGQDATVEMLPGENNNPHEYEPTIADRRRLQNAHLLLVNGLALEPYDAHKLAEAAGATLVDCSKTIPEDHLLGEEEEEEGHGHDHAHDHGAHNPHVWLSVEGASLQADAIAEAMAGFDTAHADAYRSRAAELKKRLAALRDEYAPKLKALKKTRFVSNHDAFPYFAREFGLQQVGVIQRNPGDNPTVEERREIEAMLKDGRAQAIFMEPGFDDSAARAIAESAGLPLATLDPFGVGKPAPDALERVLRANLETVLKTLGD
jgi:ABC-type Zn uptake system ZnuABC Zn-binding protein ZnuA